MKHLIVRLRLPLLLFAVTALSHSSFAAQRVFLSLTAAPASTNVVPGVATNLSTTVTIATGSSASTSYTGTGIYTLSLAPAEPTISLSLSTTNFNLPTRPSSDNTTLFFSTTASTPSNTYTVTIIGSTNDFAINNPTKITNTFVVTMSSAAPFNPLKVWTPAGANTNWSVAGNWTPSGSPGSSNDVKFFDAGAVTPAGTVNNYADASFILGSLTFGQTNNTHTTLVAPGATLRVTGTNGLSVGTGTDPGDGQLTTAAITGVGGALVVSNTAANLTVGQPHPTSNNGISQSQAALDLSGLDTFTARASRVLVGVDVSIKGSGGVLKLAKTNSITVTAGSTAPQIDVGDNSQSGGSPTIASILLLGQTNAVFADSIAVGRGKTDVNGASMHFNSSFASPVAYFRGTNGSNSRVGTWSVGDAAGSRTFVTVGTNDFSLGSVDARVDTMFVGKGASVALGAGANNPGTGYLIFNAGTVDVNTLEVGYSIDAPGTGTVNANGGSLIANASLELAHGATATGNLNLSSATVTANNGIVNGGGAGNITMNSSTLNAANYNSTIGTASSPIDVLAMTNSALRIPAQNVTPSVTVDTLACGGATNAINISTVPAFSSVPAQFTLVKYTIADGDLATFVLGTMPAATPAFEGYVSNNVANLSLDLVITNGPVTPPLVWNGGINGDWDTTTANWKTNGSPSTYQQNYPIVRLDDTLTGTSTVNLTTALTPGDLTSSLTVDNSATNYTLVGAGKISGVTGLNKQGSGTLILDQTGINDFTGGVTISGGTLQIGNNSARGNLPAGAAVTDNANLQFSRSDDLTVANVISGTGTLTKNAGSILTLGASNSAFAGEIIVAQGTLKAGTILALGTAAGGTTISNGATLDVNGQKFNNAEPVTASGAGVGGAGAIINNSTNNTTQVLRVVTLTGSTTFGGISDWDIHSSGNATSDATLNTSNNANKLTKVGTNTVTLFGVTVDANLGDIDLVAGTLSVERNTTGLGNPVNTITVFTNATLQFQNASNIWSKAVVLKDGSTLRGVNRDEFAGPVTLEGGAATFLTGTGGQLILDAIVSGAGGLTKNGVGLVTLVAANTYTGATLVNSGTLSLVEPGSISNSTSITVAAGATMNVAERSDQTLTLTGGQSLKGSGTVVGTVIVPAGATLSVGGPGTNTIGTLTITNNLVMEAGSTNLMEVGKVGTNVVNDQAVSTNVTYGGTLTVTGAGGAFVAGDTFKLFSAGSYGGLFSTINLPVGVNWNTSQLGVNGTIQVVSVTPPNISSFANTSTNFQLTFTGPAGNSYRVWASTNVAATPITNTWTVIASGLFNNTGTATVADNSTTNYPMRFYLISVP